MRISEAEFTCEGFETGGLDPFRRYAAGIACHYTGREPAKEIKANWRISDFSRSVDGVNFMRWRDTPVLPHGAEGSWNA